MQLLQSRCPWLGMLCYGHGAMHAFVDETAGASCALMSAHCVRCAVTQNVQRTCSSRSLFSCVLLCGFAKYIPTHCCLGGVQRVLTMSAQSRHLAGTPLARDVQGCGMVALLQMMVTHAHSACAMHCVAALVCRVGCLCTLAARIAASAAFQQHGVSPGCCLVSCVAQVSSG